MKTVLTPVEKIKAAYFYHVLDIDQPKIAVVLEVSNPARANEAIKLVEKAVGISEGGYKDNAQ